MRVVLPQGLEPGQYQLWVHAGNGGKFRLGRPAAAGGSRGVAVQARPRGAFRWRKSPGSGRSPRRRRRRNPADSRGNLNLASTLVIPAKVHVAGAGIDRTVLFRRPIPPRRWPRQAAWIGTASPTACIPRRRNVYKVQFPATGRWTVWLRYGTDMAGLRSPGVSKHMTISMDGGEPVRWTIFPIRAASRRRSGAARRPFRSPPGRTRWFGRTSPGGGISLDAFVFSLAPKFVPGDNPFPVDGPQTVVVQGEDILRFQAADGSLPDVDRPVVWLSGDGASISSLTLRGNAANQCRHRGP